MVHVSLDSAKLDHKHIWILSGKDVQKPPPAPCEVLYILSQKRK